MKYNLNDTIVGIATAVSNGGISIIRISGVNAFSIANKIFSKDITLFNSHTINYGFIIDNNKKIDEVMLSVMKGPKTYTLEDIVEINCHGGMVTTTKILNLCIGHGCRLADAGEFTKRAFLNGRIDLAEAEAVGALINAKTEKAADIFINQLSGGLSNEIIEYREKIIKVIASVEASIDYPEHDLEHDNIELIENNIDDLIFKIEKLVLTANKGKIIKEGIETVIIGRPNVGKSSLLNKLAGEEVAIVTEKAGTTRDVLTEYININGLMLKIIDTAGIRNTDDEIEKIGVEKSKERAEKGELILFLIDGSKKIDKEDLEILQTIKDKNVIIIINKTDLTVVAKIDQLLKFVNKDKIIFTSILNNDVDEFYNILNKMFLSGYIDNEVNNLIANNRQEGLLKNSLESLKNVKTGIELGMTEDLLVIDLKDSYEFLGEIIGVSIDDDIVDKIFSEFCLGK